MFLKGVSLNPQPNRPTPTDKLGRIAIVKVQYNPCSVGRMVEQ